MLAVSILSFICGFTGCKKTPDHTADDIRVVSVSCSHMDFCFGYSFSLTLSENGALLSAECFTDRESERVEIEDIPISKEDADGLIDIIRDGDLISKLKANKKPKRIFQVLDETVYSSYIEFSDGEHISASMLASSELTDRFYGLAEKYGASAPNMD